MRRQLTRVNVRKARGPDNINPRVLKGCAAELAEPFQHLFNLSLGLGKVPQLWKTSCIVPVPKKGRPSTLNDYRPVALTSQVMKILERLVLHHLKPQVEDYLDPLQFAYREGVGVEDAIIYMLHRAYAHLEKSRSTVRIMFFDFSSAFNTIKPSLLAEKLAVMRVEETLISWTHDYLTNRQQYVRLQGCQSEMVVCSTGAPQGTVMSPFLFTLYTSDFQANSNKCHLQKFSDDSSIVGYIRGDNDKEYRALVENFVADCDSNHLLLNTSKTKEMVVHFGRKRKTPTPITIRGEEVEIVDRYKYLGVHINNKLDWKHNTEALYRKGQSRLFFLRRLRSFNVRSELLRLFYQSVVASALFFAVACWGGNAGATGAAKLNKLVKKAGSVVGGSLETLEEVAEQRTRRRLRAILENPTHPLNNEVARSTFSHRLISPHQHTNRFGLSFVPTAIRLYNDAGQGQ